MSTRRDNEALVDRLIGLTDDIRQHMNTLHEAGDHDGAEAWDDVRKYLLLAEGCAPCTEDRP